MGTFARPAAIALRASDDRRCGHSAAPSLSYCAWRFLRWASSFVVAVRSRGARHRGRAL